MLGNDRNIKVFQIKIGDIKMSAIKVLMVLPTLSVVGGVENYAMNYFRNLDHTSVHMDIVIYKLKVKEIEKVRKL